MLARQVLQAVKTAYAFRQVSRVKELSYWLLGLPTKEYQLIGQYYLAWSGCREKHYRAEALEQVIDQTHTYKTQALLSRAAIEGYQGHTETELYFYTEALKTARSLSDSVEASRCIAIVKAQEGFHASALKDVESLMPLLRYTEPLVHYSLLNSYAVELGEVGRLTEARNISRIVLASPLAHAYPEWSETAEQLRERNRSFLAVNPSRSGNVLRFRPQELPSEPVTEKAKILSLSERLEKRRQAVKRKAEKAFKIRTTILSDDLPESVIDSILRILGIHYD